jgi:hypothetical protein
MKCPYCQQEIGGPIVGPKQLSCPKCGESLVQLDLIFKEEELGAFNTVVDQAMHDPDFYGELRQDPFGVLEANGISRETSSQVVEVMDQLGVPVVAACMTDPDSWPDIEFPEEIESPKDLRDKPGEVAS